MLDGELIVFDTATGRTSFRLTLATLQQHHLDTWAAGNPTLRARSIPFIRWAVARNLTAALTIDHPPTRPPSNFQVDQVHHDELRRCLTDTSLPLQIRIAGALTRLYALPLTRIVELTVSQFHRDDENAYLTINLQPVVLPPSLAQLIETHIHTAAAAPHHRAGSANHYLLPGQSPGQPRNPAGLADAMRRFDLPARAARNTAMMQALADLPPIVIADLFGMNPGTVHRWAQFAGNSWDDYLAAQP
ncbi:hypothetical protein GCM10010166_27090 [Couchioplanes caeruleus subsp. azureus]|nr:hypothetical protein [Couchioplanes caeruleus]GGQ56220.1 hypothetical protein GCM10010166_27090 [Couchioplanes caeruleus subsp. azureus]